MSYLARFDRISRNHNVEPMPVGDDGDDIAEQVHAYAFPRCGSRDISVTVDMDTLAGTIFAGMHIAGRFTLEPQAAS